LLAGSVQGSPPARKSKRAAPGRTPQKLSVNAPVTEAL
jgi:hypothetical protein